MERIAFAVGVIDKRVIDVHLFQIKTEYSGCVEHHCVEFGPDRNAYREFHALCVLVAYESCREYRVVFYYSASHFLAVLIQAYVEEVEQFGVQNIVSAGNDKSCLHGFCSVAYQAFFGLYAYNVCFG